KEGEFVKINKKEKHRITGLENSWILETAFGQMRENDVIRFKDDYGRNFNRRRGSSFVQRAKN
ncbi:MAG: hypothetical protein ABIF84_02705, partial [Patescibacteria group bacterium]